MAVQKETVARRLALRVQYTDDKGAEKFRNLSFAHVAQDATDEHIYAAGKALAGLQSKPLDRVAKIETIVYTDGE